MSPPQITQGPIEVFRNEWNSDMMVMVMQKNTQGFANPGSLPLPQMKEKMHFESLTNV